MSTQISKKMTLEELLQRKAEVIKELDVQKKAMTSTAHQIIAPVTPAASHAHSLTHSFNRGMAIFEGLVVGVKTINKIRNFFGGGKRKRRR